MEICFESQTKFASDMIFDGNIVSEMPQGSFPCNGWLTPNWWLIARLWYLHCLHTGDTTAIDLFT